MLRTVLATVVTVMASVVLLSGCGDDEAAAKGTAKLQFQNLHRSASLGGVVPLASGLRVAETPTLYEMKFIAAYLAEDIDPGTGNNIGKTSMFYLNPQCNNDIGHCDIDAGNNGVNGEPITEIVTNFFDFTDTAAANTAVNAQGLSIDAGTYKYVRLEFCKGGAGSNNIRYQDATMAAAYAYRRGACTVNSAEMVPPMVLEAGGTVTVTLAYDTTEAVKDGLGRTDAECDQVEDRCFEQPTFTPSAN